MFDNLLYQSASHLIREDIVSNRLPGAILLSGPVASGKLTCALEIARILSCTGNNVYKQRGHWLCECPACKKNKELVNQNILLSGPRDCSLEILASEKTFLQAAINNEKYINATRYLFIRAVRKLTMRFSQILWENDDKVSKISPLIQGIDEQLELISPEKTLPEYVRLEKICSELVKLTAKLESSFMYDSIPVSQMRKASSWAHMKSPEGKKVLIIENADRMLESVRNAMLKILEEPPEDTVFILTTSRRGAVMPTILSRVRTYTFNERSLPQQSEVIQRVFHDEKHKDQTIDSFLQSFLPVGQDVILESAESFCKAVSAKRFDDIEYIVKSCNGFDPRVLLKLFFNEIVKLLCADHLSPSDAEKSYKIVGAVREAYNNVTVYNQTCQSALEKLSRDIIRICNA